MARPGGAELPPWLRRSQRIWGVSEPQVLGEREKALSILEKIMVTMPYVCVQQLKPETTAVSHSNLAKFAVVRNF